MGLAASQARLLTITSRKSDCEYQSMRLSHEKIALSREMTEISNEYQKSLNQSNLYYDFYGTGDRSNPLTYGLLMSPSALNDYLPTLICNQQGRVVLDGKYAAAAKAAGIPQEGLGSLPSDEMRNAFVEGLFQNGIITKKTKDAIQSTTYNQAAGLGSIDMITINTIDGNIDTLIDVLQQQNITLYTEKLEMTKHQVKDEKEATCTVNTLISSGGTNTEVDEAEFLLSDLFSDKQTYLNYGGIGGEQTPVYGLAMMVNYLTMDGGLVDNMYEAFAEVLNVDDYTAMALKYAKKQTDNLLIGGQYDNIMSWMNKDPGKDLDEQSENRKNRYFDAVGTDSYKQDDCHRYNQKIVLDSSNYIGFTYGATKQEGSHDDGKDRGTLGLNLNNLARTFLTYFAQYMEGIISQDNTNGYTVIKGHKNASNLVTDDKSYIYKIKTGVTISGEDSKMALFYDTLFNQLCTKGWTENNEVNDKEYLKEMLKSGMMFITSVSDDGYYNMDNFSTNTYLKEVSDDSAIAEAEAKYKTQKSRLTAKEDELDLKMKNLDTEISSLTTEYDSVKSVITKNIEKSFKRYNA